MGCGSAMGQNVSISYTQTDRHQIFENYASNRKLSTQKYSNQQNQISERLIQVRKTLQKYSSLCEICANHKLQPTLQIIPGFENCMQCKTRGIVLTGSGKSSPCPGQYTSLLFSSYCYQLMICPECSGLGMLPQTNK